jgi:putative spermidine/putrescine transport system permease protein
MANILANISIKHRTTLYVILLTPILVPQFVYFYGIQNVFAKIGIVNTYIGVILSHVIVMMPYAIINLSNDILLYGKKYEEVAFVMGASDYRFYKDIMLPLIKGTLINTLGLLFIISFSQYFITLMIGGGVAKTYATYIFPLILGNDRNFAAKAAFIYIAINIIIYIIFVSRKREVTNE